MTKNNHPFYCFKKNCRKTAWDTPEYLNKFDWSNVEYVIELLKKNDSFNFWKWVTMAVDSRDFFNKVVGWPEGWSYCWNFDYCEKTAIPMLIKDLDKMQESLDNHMGKI